MTQAVMKKQKMTAKLARARSQLYLDAIANFIQIETHDLKVQEEEKLMVQQLKACAERWRRASK